MLKSKIKIILILLFISFCCLSLFFVYRMSKTLDVNLKAAVKTGGEYIKFLQAFQTVLNNDSSNYSLEMDHLDSKDASISSIKHLENNLADIALVQSNSKYDGSKVSSIANVFFEPVLFFSNTKDICSISDLAKYKSSIRCVYLGHQTQTAKDFNNLLSFYGIKKSKFELIEANYDSSFTLLKQKKVDMGFFIVGLGNSAIKSMFSDTTLHVITLENNEAYLSMNKNYQEYSVFKGLFGLNYPKKDYRTFATSAMMVCRRDLETNDVFELTKALFEKQAEISVKYPFIHVEPVFDAHKNSIPIHQGALLYYNKNEPTYIDKNSTLIGTIVSILGLVISSLPLIKTLRSVK
jgi:TRAP transporter TAXI family solute receptor